MNATQESNQCAVAERRTSMSVAEVADRVRTGNAQLIDVRTPVEYQEVHIPEARNVPLDRLDPQALLGDDLQREVFVVCKGGTRGAKACERLAAAGYLNAVNVQGGTEAWVAAGLPVTRGKKAVSLERQVRIVAGLIALIGSVLALSLNVWFALIPAFIGAGLAFAGITDTCAMGMLLARMPWNQVASSPTCDR